MFKKVRKFVVTKDGIQKEQKGKITQIKDLYGKETFMCNGEEITSFGSEIHIYIGFKKGLKNLWTCWKSIRKDVWKNTRNYFFESKMIKEIVFFNIFLIFLRSNYAIIRDTILDIGIASHIYIALCFVGYFLRSFGEELQKYVDILEKTNVDPDFTDCSKTTHKE